MRRPTPLFVPRRCCESKTARVRARVRGAAEQASCHVRPRTRRHARSPVRRRCSEPSSRSQQTLAARHRSEQRRLVALWSRRLSGVRRRVHIHKREEPRKTPLSRDRYRDTTVLYKKPKKAVGERVKAEFSSSRLRSGPTRAHGGRWAWRWASVREHATHGCRVTRAGRGKGIL